MTNKPRYQFTAYTDYPYKPDLYTCHIWTENAGYCYAPGLWTKAQIDMIPDKSLFTIEPAPDASTRKHTGKRG